VTDLTYKQLERAVTDLGKSISRGADALAATAQYIAQEASDTARVAEMIANMGVDTATVGETHELAQIMRGVGDASTDYLNAGLNTVAAANAAWDQARTTHAGIQEAFRRAAFDMSNLDHNFLREE
jgi:hypothetical protein